VRLRASPGRVWTEATFAVSTEPPVQRLLRTNELQCCSYELRLALPAKYEAVRSIMRQVQMFALKWGLAWFGSDEVIPKLENRRSTSCFHGMAHEQLDGCCARTFLRQSATSEMFAKHPHHLACWFVWRLLRKDWESFWNR